MEKQKVTNMHSNIILHSQLYTVVQISRVN